MLDDAHNYGKVWRNKPAVQVMDTRPPPKDYAEPDEIKSSLDRLDELPEWQRALGILLVAVGVMTVFSVVIAGLFWLAGVLPEAFATLAGQW